MPITIERGYETQPFKILTTHKAALTDGRLLPSFPMFRNVVPVPDVQFAGKGTKTRAPN